MSIPLAWRILVLVCLFWWGQTCLGDELQIASFETDVSPPLNERVGVGFQPTYQSLEHPLKAKGIVLKQGGVSYVVCSIDYTGLCGTSYDLFRDRIADGAGTTSDFVMLSAVHQHTAPTLDIDAVSLLYDKNSEQLASIRNFEETTAKKIQDCVSEATKDFHVVSHVGSSKALVREVASTRRLRQPDGSIKVRLSSTTDPVLQNAPEGKIDPWLRTIAFYSDERILACLHYYACHPQSFYGDGRITWDVPGIARERLQKESGVFQVYFNGCGGDIAMGKYNDGTREARERLAQRLYAGMVSSVSQLEKQAAGDLEWRTSPLKFPLRSEPAFSVKYQRKILDSPTATFSRKLKAAMLLAWIDRTRNRREPLQACCLSLGTIHLVHLPGEVFAEYQLYAQQLPKNQFVAVAAYGECGMWYIGPDRIYQDIGGYEQTWSFSGPMESQLKKALRQILIPKED
ncbi:hypothetical protein [Thalassoroseus pseudoceratinae]|uniref:hypothetical protein n=1 Tax=Thalassoroseus pseudoceratinae TaxID=2713176 RepID=UPI001420C1CF|nr:hypothetical protein [Thalassoroseus pseudoceratinae]